MKAGFKIKYVYPDKDFMPVLSEMAFKFQFMPNIAAVQEHVPSKLSKRGAEPCFMGSHSRY
jgi:hypothetical protein